jgi:hypothetical protein
MEGDIDLIGAPWNIVKAQLLQAAVLARSTYAASTRTALKECWEIDATVLGTSLAKFSAGDRDTISYVGSCGAWSQEAKFTRNLTSDHRCPHCLAPHQDIAHTLWRCPGLADTYRIEGALSKIDYRDLPPHLEIGVPSALAAALESVF